MNEAGEVDGASVVARCEAAEMFETAEAALDPISLLVGVLVTAVQKVPLSKLLKHRDKRRKKTVTH